MTKRHDLDALCAAFGIGREYYEIGGKHRVVPEKSLRALLGAMHVALGGGADLKRARAGARSGKLAPHAAAGTGGACRLARRNEH